MGCSRRGAGQRLFEVAASGLAQFCSTHSRPAPRDTRKTMKNLALHVKKFLKSEDGPTAVEYAVMLALIVIVCLVSITAIGNNANATFDSIAQALPGAS